MFSFGYNSFWNFMHGSPAVQELLNRPNLTVEELLEEDGLLLELKTLNQKLLNFLLKEENFKRLMYYVITEPDPEEAKINQKKCYKYPFVCADVLSSDSPAIVSEFFKELSAITQSKDDEEPEDEVSGDVETLDKEESPEKTKSTEDTSGESQEEPAKEPEQTEEKPKEESAEQAETAEGETESPTKSNKSQQEEEKTATQPSTPVYPYMDYLFTFLDGPQINLTSAGYFAKIVNNLFAKKPSDVLVYLYENKPIVLEKMADNIASKSVAEFLAKVLTFESSILISYEDEIYNTKRNEILKLILKKLEPSNDIEEINNTAYLLCEVLGKYNTMHCSQEILQNLLETSTIDYFFELLKTKDATTCCAVALILGNIFAYYILINTSKLQQNADESGDVENNPPQLELTEDIPLVAGFIKNLESIVRYIAETSGNSFTSQYGANVVPFGSARLKLVELIIIAMKANNQKIYDKLFEYGFFEGLLKLFVKYEWNNILHNQVEKVLTIILDSRADDLKARLFEQSKLLSWISDTTGVSEYKMGGKHERKIRKGYMGQLTKLANKIAESKDPAILKFTESDENWKDFTETQLAEINHRNDIKLGGRDPRGPIEEEEPAGEVPDMMHKFQQFFNGMGKAQQKDDDEDEEENEGDEDLNRAQEEDDDEDEDDRHENKDTQHVLGHDDGKHIIRIGSGNETQGNSRLSFGYPKSYDDDEEENEKDTAEQQYEAGRNGYAGLEDIKSEEQVLEGDYSPNRYWKREDWHSADDILKEIGEQ